MNRPAPFLKRSAQRMAAGGYLDTTLHAIHGPDGWAMAKRVAECQAVALLPPGNAPSAFDWQLAAQFPSPVLLHCAGDPDPQQADQLASALIQAGCRRVLGVRADQRCQRWLHPLEVQHGA